MMRRPGRPTGPAEGRRKKPWDPARLRPRDKEALMYVAANSDLERYKVAEFLDISLARLSVLTCSPLGQRYLAELESGPPSLLAPYRLFSGKLAHCQ